MQRHSENDRNRHKAGTMFRDQTGREGYGRDYGGRTGYGRDEHGRPGFNPPFPGREAFGGGQQYGRDFSRGQPERYGVTFGGWERHLNDFNGQEYYQGPPPMQFQGEDRYEGQGYPEEHLNPDRTIHVRTADRPLRVRMGELVNPAPRPQRPSFAGKGPKNYRRGDERILEDVNDVFTEHHELDATEIEVSVAAGEVTLDGMVSRKGSKRLAEDLAYMIRGVVEVHNRLRIVRDLEGKSTLAQDQPRPGAQADGRPAGLASKNGGSVGGPGRAH